MSNKRTNIWGPIGASRFTGKWGAYGKSLDAQKKFHMWEPIGNSDPHFPARPGLPPSLLYHTPARMSIGNLYKNKKNNWWFSPPIISKVSKGVFIFVFFEEFPIFATVTASHIIKSFLPAVSATTTIKSHWLSPFLSVINITQVRSNVKPFF